jgi:hypothetical protein
VTALWAFLGAGVGKFSYAGSPHEDAAVAVCWFAPCGKVASLAATATGPSSRKEAATALGCTAPLCTRRVLPLLPGRIMMDTFVCSITRPGVCHPSRVLLTRRGFTRAPGAS